MKPKKKHAGSKPGQSLIDMSKSETTDETTLMEKLKLQNTALEKIKTAVYANNGTSQDESEQQ